MSALVLTLFVSLGLGALGVLLYANGVHQGDHEHTDRLALFPLHDDDAPDASEKD
jgi:nitrogen fixation-related uncharacterized protein